MRSPRLWFVVLLMSFTALVLHVRGDSDRVLPSRPLSELPTTLAGRNAIDIKIDQETLDILGKGDFLNRIYVMPPETRASTPGGAAPVELFVGYFPTQRTGQSIHSPQNCLPGAGWTFQTRAITELTDATGKTYRVGEYLIVNGAASQEVLYWYQMHGRSIASDYQAKLYTLADSIRLGRTDAALVRVITPLGQNESQQQAHDRVVNFAEQLTPLLPAYVPN